VSRLTPQSWQTLVKVFKALGFTEKPTKATSHIVMTKPKTLRPVIIPKYSEVGLDIITSNLRTAGVSREKYLEILAKL